MRKRRTSSERSRIYLDYAAATPVDPRVFRAMRPYFSERFGNPGSLHSFGQEAIAAVDRAREVVARAAGTDFRGVIFTASATEANNLAIRGAIARWRRGGQASGAMGQEKETRARGPRPAAPRIVVSSVEHESILETLRDMETRRAARVTILPVNRAGVVDVRALAKALDSRTALVSAMYANNETGAIQRIAEIAKIVSGFRGANPYPLFHTDAAQAFQFLPCGARELGADMVTLSAHKIYGPKGIGALCVGQGVRLSPLITGGGQEFGLRSGTENVPAIAGFGEAVRIVEESRERDARRIATLRDRFLRGLKKITPKLRVNGPEEAADRLPHILNVYLPGILAEELLTALDLAGVAVSAGSACSARSSAPSHVLLAMGLGERRARESVRVSFGRSTTVREVDGAIARIKAVLPSLVKKA